MSNKVNNANEVKNGAENTAENTIESEIKAIAKAIGASLKRDGHAVPHSNLLKAVAAALNKRDWHKLKNSLSSQNVAPEVKLVKLPESWKQEKYFGPSVSAKFWTDDRVVEAEFDAAQALCALNDETLFGIIRCGYSSDYPTDNVAESAIDYNDDVKKGFEYLSLVNSSNVRESIGFECSINEHEFLEWFKAMRPDFLNTLLVRSFGIIITQTQEEGEGDMWDWFESEKGNGCEHSFETQQEAINDACLRLDLFERVMTEGFDL